MKKIIILIIILMLGYFVLNEAKAFVIPDEAIRLRVVANSNTEYDQKIKNEVSEVVQKRLYQLLKDKKGIEEARKTVKGNIDVIKKDIELLLNKKNYELGYKITYGMNYFPEKEYKGTIYEEGEYESLLITLGSGEGNNWWCVLFPPLCLIEAEESEEVEYSFFIKELFEKYL